MADQVLLLSIKERWVRLILSGRKTVELRTKPPKIGGPTPTLIYQSGEGGCLRAVCKMGPIISDSPERLWERVGLRSCVPEGEFGSYFEGRKTAYALEIAAVSELSRPIPLDELRQEAGFTAPQGCVRAPQRLLDFLATVKR